MPKASFPGQIHVVRTEEQTIEAVAYLSTCKLVGIDSETRPSFTKGHTNKVALLQIASEEHCYLFRLNITGLTKPLVELLEDSSVVKVGLSLRDDFLMLHKRANFRPQGYIELQDYVHRFGIEEMSLRKIYGILFGEKISKAQRLSNWEAETLTHAQQLYAATDAWACINIYELLCELERTGDYTVIATDHAQDNPEAR